MSKFGDSAPSNNTLMVSVKSHVSVQRGHTAILPCWLAFSQSAEDMEVRWYQKSDQFGTPILLYKARAFDYSSQKASYAGRASFGLKEETSGGLKAGDVSLKLEKATIKDTGKYTCFVSSSGDHDDRASINLIVTETGHQPLLSAVMKDHKKVNMSCQSDGWHPEPDLSWSDSKKANVLLSKNSTGFYSVHSWVLVSSPCQVSFFLYEKDFIILIKHFTILVLYLETEYTSVGWKAAFGTVFVLLIAAIAVIIYLCVRKQSFMREKPKTGRIFCRGSDEDPP
uniref:Ig-like domain-containing protein n=1 Tax=Poecilia latipinna TaxID=48699 RepID=A0A3B3U703_9TELE